ncbi:MAG: hypothetical protein B6242_02995 [Anaerolineaceae bacterium 4572_78]|nr:MAG: hypothetical protein B6242_02995 [Anaerolineaceae bacterium 4572_78]
MISTLITTTSTVITTSALVSSLSLVAILTLLVLLIKKELASTITNIQAKTLEKFLNVGVVPLLLTFALIVVVKVAEILQSG